MLNLRNVDVFWKSSETIGEGVPVLQYFEFEGHVYSLAMTQSEALPGVPPVPRVNEVMFRPARGKQQASLVELPSQNKRLGLPPANIGMFARDSHGSQSNFYVEQKGYRYATRRDIETIIRQAEANQAVWEEGRIARDPVKAEAAKAAVMADAIGNAVTKAVAAIFQKKEKEART